VFTLSKQPGVVAQAALTMHVPNSLAMTV
jgi:hypothetical protein